VKFWLRVVLEMELCYIIPSDLGPSVLRYMIHCKVRGKEVTSVIKLVII
jgi:hypothetical protein